MSLKTPPELPPESTPETSPDTPLNPSTVPVEQLARMLGLANDHMGRHVAEGAPTNANGSINLVHYAGWLNSDTGQTAANSGGA